MDETEKLVTERRRTHGRFKDQARITQLLKAVLHHEIDVARSTRGQDFSDQHIESLEMIAHKIGRIIAGDPSFADHWEDIAGYAKIAHREF